MTTFPHLQAIRTIAISRETVRRALLKNRRLCVIYYNVQSTARLEGPYFEFPVGQLELSLKLDTYEVTLKTFYTGRSPSPSSAQRLTS